MDEIDKDRGIRINTFCAVPRKTLHVWQSLRAMGMSRSEAVVAICAILIILADVALFGATAFDC